jgi:hypothetical protein
MNGIRAIVAGIIIAATTSCGSPTPMTLKIVDAGTSQGISGVQPTELDVWQDEPSGSQRSTTMTWPASDRDGVTTRAVPLNAMSEIEILAPGYQDARITGPSPTFDPQVNVETPATRLHDGPKSVSFLGHPVVVQLFRQTDSGLWRTTPDANGVTPTTGVSIRPTPAVSTKLPADDAEAYWKDYISLMDEIATTLKSVKTLADARAIIPRVEELGKRMTALESRGAGLNTSFSKDRLQAMSEKYSRQLEKSVDRAGHEVDRIAGDPALGTVLRWDNRGFLRPVETSRPAGAP